MNTPALIALFVLLAIALGLYIYERHLAYKIANEEYIGEIVIDDSDGEAPSIYFVSASDIQTLKDKRYGRVAVIRYHSE